MELNEIREYNKIVLDTVAECVKPWRYATIILSLLLFGMIALYFLNPVEIDLDQSNNYSPEALNING